MIDDLHGLNISFSITRSLFLCNLIENMSNTVYPLCARCCLKFQLPEPHNARLWRMVSSCTGSLLITRPLSSDTLNTHIQYAYIHTLICMQTHTHTNTQVQMHMHTPSHKITHKAALVFFLLLKNHQFPKRAFLIAPVAICLV